MKVSRFVLLTAAIAAVLVALPAGAPARTPSKVPGKVLRTAQVTFVNGVVIRVYASRVVRGSSATLYFTEYAHAKGKPFSFIARLKVPRPFYPDSRIVSFTLTRSPTTGGYSRFNANGAISWYPHASSTQDETHYWGAAFHGDKLQWYS